MFAIDFIIANNDWAPTRIGLSRKPMRKNCRRQAEIKEKPARMTRPLTHARTRARTTCSRVYKKQTFSKAVQ